MKKLFVILLFLFFSNLIIFAQPCLPEGITFTTQVQIDSFQINYPNCTEVEGEVIIGDWDSTAINNLTDLSVLTSFGQGLWIENNNNLVGLSGLDNITNIGGNLVIKENDILSNLTGLNTLVTIVGDIEIQDNAALLSFMGLDNLTSIGGSLQIYDNDNLINLNGLENLSSIEGDLIIGHNNTLYGGNPSLTNISGLSMLTSIGGVLRVSNNNILTSLEGLENIDAGTIYGLFIENNNSLSSCEVESICDYLSNPMGTVNIENNAPGCNFISEVIDACDGICLPYGIAFNSQEEIDNFQNNYPNCTEIAGNVVISGQDITNLFGMDILTSVWGNLIIGGNLTLASFAGFDSLTFIGENLLIAENDILYSLANFAKLNTIAGNLKIADNDALVSLSGLENLTSIGNHIRIINNSLLFDLAGLDNVNNVWGNLVIDNNNNLVNLSGLSNIQGIIGDLKIRDNDYLESFSGLDNLVSIGGNFLIQNNNTLLNLLSLNDLTFIGGLEIVNNDALTNLTGAENINSIWGNIFILDNDTLNSLAGLDSITPEIIEYLAISGNSALSDCAIESICDYLDLPNSILEISDNATGCNSVEEVEEACWTSVTEICCGDIFTIIPNPLESNAVITYTLNQSSPVTLKFLDLNGRLVVSLVDEFQQHGEQRKIFHGDGLKSGIYFCMLITNEGMQTKKIIKL
ncbi:MAG: T9SS type A sorting domain-containing protein [Bacteroidales bacterium]|nr:T9SS type A sorting domain-containing protein [Bacteroidales bacterium]